MNVWDIRVVEDVLGSEVRADRRFQGAKDRRSDVMRERRDCTDAVEQERSRPLSSEEIGSRYDREMSGVRGEEVTVRSQVSSTVQ